MGAAVVAPPAAAAAAVALAEAAPAVAPLVAAGPAGWLVAGVVGAAGAVIVAGDGDLVDRRCWQQIILPSAGGEVSESAFSNSINSVDDAEHEPIDIDIDFHNKHGMLLSHVLLHTKAFKSDDDGRFIVKNKRNDYFAFSVSLVVPVHETGPELEYDVTVVHAVPVDRRDIGSYSPL